MANDKLINLALLHLIIIYCRSIALLYFTFSSSTSPPFTPFTSCQSFLSSVNKKKNLKRNYLILLLNKNRFKNACNFY